MRELKKYKGIITCLIILFFMVLFLIWQNNGLAVTTMEFEGTSVSENLNRFKIVQISDLHNKTFGSNQKPLIKSIEKQNPNIIVVTGDLVDSSKTDIDTAMIFIKNAVKIAPVYFVSGNHEAWSNQYNQLKERLTNEGVIILDNESNMIHYNGARLNLIGISDPSFFSSLESSIVQVITDNMSLDKDVPNILLAHRSELLNLYAESGVDLVFSGHAHGGQFRLPFVGGLVAPDQGFFPKYTSGAYEMDSTTMIVSRGLGNSIIPIRIFNRPEIIVVTLRSDF